ncbi:MAG: hypothetical protein ACRDYA_13545 [Egibacteraceae bacterium]
MGRFAPAVQRGLERLGSRGTAAALDEPDYLMVIASPATAESKWVSQEIEHWKETKPVERILLVVTEGSVNGRQSWRLRPRPVDRRPPPLPGRIHRGAALAGPALGAREDSARPAPQPPPRDAIELTSWARSRTGMARLAFHLA